MKIDYDFMKDILTIIEDFDNPLFSSVEVSVMLFDFEGATEQENIDKLYFHFQILLDKLCITKAMSVRDIKHIDKNNPYYVECEEITPHDDAGFDIEGSNIKYTYDLFRLTHNGHNLLISLESSPIMEQLKKSGSKIAIDTLIKAGTNLGTKLLSSIPNLF